MTEPVANVWRISGEAVRVLRPELIEASTAIRILVTGSRNWPRERAVEVRDAIAAVARGHHPVTIVHGAARGADTWADLTAERLGFTVERHPADWARHGKAAGMIRNRTMVAAGADVVLAFPLGHSPGTRGCIREAERAGLPVLVHPSPASRTSSDD